MLCRFLLCEMVYFGQEAKKFHPAFDALQCVAAIISVFVMFIFGFCSNVAIIFIYLFCLVYFFFWFCYVKYAYCIALILPNLVGWYCKPEIYKQIKSFTFFVWTKSTN